MFIAARLPLLISAKSEMLIISLFAAEVRRPRNFYKHYVPTARLCPNSLGRSGGLPRNRLAVRGGGDTQQQEDNRCGWRDSFAKEAATPNALRGLCHASRILRILRNDRQSCRVANDTISRHG